MTWKTKVSKANVLLFQLQASVHGIKGNESGLWLTPTATDMSVRSEEAMEKRKEYRSKIGRKTVPPGSLSEQVMYGKPTKNMYPTPVVSDHLHNQSESIENWQKRAKEKKKQGINLHFALRHHVQMYPTPTQDSASERTKKYSQGGMPLPMAVKMFPTPTAGCVEGGEQSSRVEMTEKGGFILRKKNKPENTFGAKLSDAMLYLEKMYPTPVARDHKDAGYNITWKESRDQKSSLPRQVLKDNKPGGRLNPNFVEFLMGYPMNWTKIDPTE
jgi:DNA (cytosine-5)-methyltransferase 1